MTHGLRSGRAVAPVGPSETVAVIDGALRRASQRRIFTRDEILELFHEISASVDAPALGAGIASIVNDALLSYGSDQLVERRRVVDPLLDVRLLVRR